MPGTFGGLRSGLATMCAGRTSPLLSLSQYEQISTIGNTIGRRLVIEEISPDEARREGLAAMPPSIVAKLLDAWAAAVGQPAFVTPTGTQARTFLEWVTVNVAEFRS